MNDLLDTGSSPVGSTKFITTQIYQPMKNIINSIREKWAKNKQMKKERMSKALLFSCYFSQIGLNNQIRNIDRNANPVWK